MSDKDLTPRINKALSPLNNKKNKQLNFKMEKCFEQTFLGKYMDGNKHMKRYSALLVIRKI